MTVLEAEDIKSILVQCQGTIPAQYVDRIFHYYKSHIDPNAGKPCTCTPRYWNDMLISLKNKVEEILDANRIY